MQEAFFIVDVWIHHSSFLATNLYFIFIYVLFLSTFHWFSNKHGRKNCKWTQKYETVNNFVTLSNTICYNMKFILSYHQIKLHNEIHNITQNCTTKCATCCTIKIYITSWTVVYNIFTIPYDMKFILPCHHIKLHNEIHNTTQNCTTKCTTCCTIRLLKIGFPLCFVFFKQTKIKVTFSNEHSAIYTYLQSQFRSSYCLIFWRLLLRNGKITSKCLFKTSEHIVQTAYGNSKLTPKHFKQLWY